MQGLEVSNERSGLIRNDKKRVATKWKIGGLVGIMLVLGVVMMVGLSGSNSDVSQVVATQEHLEQHEMVAQDHDDTSEMSSVPEMDAEEDAVEGDVEEDTEKEEDGAEEGEETEAEVVADGVNIIKLAQDRYRYINRWDCPAGLFRIPIRYGKKGGGGCVCKLCPRGHRCPGNNKKIKCLCGYYQPKKGQAKCWKSPCGYYVPKIGSWYKLPCNFGTYNPYGKKSKKPACKCIPSRWGWHVPKKRACRPSRCKGGTSQHCSGQRFCIPCGVFESSKPGAKFCKKRYPKYPVYY